MKRLIGILAMLVLAGMLTACGASGKAEDSKEKLSVMTTFYPMYDFTKAIVGDEGEVELLIPAGTDSHDYEPSAKDMAKIQDTDIFVYNDENMETWVPAIQKTLQEGNVHTIKATEGMLLLPRSSAVHIKVRCRKKESFRAKASFAKSLSLSILDRCLFVVVCLCI